MREEKDKEEALKRRRERRGESKLLGGGLFLIYLSLLLLENACLCATNVRKLCHFTHGIDLMFKRLEEKQQERNARLMVRGGGQNTDCW